MSTTELVLSAGESADLAETQGETSLPEHGNAGVAYQQNDAADEADASKGSEEADKALSDEQRTIKRQSRRIDKLTAKNGAAQRETELLRQEIAELKRFMGHQQDGDTTAHPAPTKSDFDERVTSQVNAIVEQQTVRSKVAQLMRDGESIEGFVRTTDALNEAVPFQTRDGKLSPFMKAVLDVGLPASVLDYLGRNLDEAEDLAELPSAQLGWRLAEIKQKLSTAKKTVSDAPQPLKPVRSASAGIAPVRSPEDLMQQLRALR